ncbi:MAG: endonuclease III [Candidatus Micrarchaeaceae archaeon]|jgi:endonuclease-3|nr:endonuclease III [Candidatus Micrarchaeota archaeon]
MKGRKYMNEVLALLRKRYGKRLRTSLDHSNEWQLLVATMLSAQAQDRQVNKVTKRLFSKYNDIEDFASLKPQQLYPYIGSIGLYRGKARNIVNTAKILKRDFKLKIPRTIAGLTTLPGVGRKTANVVISNAFGINEGIAIDTHCITVANRLGVANTKDPKKIEQGLMKITDKKDWGDLTHLFIALGRDTCTARKKYCESCILRHICPSSDAR